MAELHFATIITPDADPVKQNNIIETAIANKVDGIALTIFVPDAFTKNIQKARDAGSVEMEARSDPRRRDRDDCDCETLIKEHRDQRHHGHAFAAG